MGSSPPKRVGSSLALRHKKATPPAPSLRLQPGNRLQVASQLSCTVVPGFGAAADALLTSPGSLCFGSGIQTDGVSCLLHAHRRSPVSRKARFGNLAAKIGVALIRSASN